MPSTIPEALEDIRAGRDGHHRRRRGPRERGRPRDRGRAVTPEAINFMARHGRGLVCLPMTGERLDELRIPLMVQRRARRALRHRVHRDDRGAHGVTTGISAADRARPRCSPRSETATRRRTLRVPATSSRCARTTAACSCAPARPRPRVDLARLAGFKPAAVICEIMNEDGTMARVPQLEEFCREHAIQDDHDPRPDPLPDGDGALRAQDRRGQAADLVRRLPRARLREPDRRPAPRRAGDGRGARRRPGAGARPLASASPATSSARAAATAATSSTRRSR